MFLSVMMQNYSIKCSVQDDKISRPSLNPLKNWNFFKQQWTLVYVSTNLPKFDSFIFKFEPDTCIFKFILCYSMTKDGNSRFYHRRVSTGTGKALIFISLEILPILCSSEELACNLTFATLPFFSQLFTIHVRGYTYEVYLINIDTYSGSKSSFKPVYNSSYINNFLQMFPLA